jgi:hypothetical protein
VFESFKVRDMTTPKRLRFNADDDLCLLREVVRENPLRDPDKWETIKKNISSAVNITFNKSFSMPGFVLDKKVGTHKYNRSHNSQQ